MPSNLPTGTVVTNLKDTITNLKNSTSNAAARVGEAWGIITGRSFNPGVPLAPTSNIEEQTQGPRQYQYPVGANMILTPRQEYPNLTPFDQLRSIANLYDVSSICIGVRVEELQGLNWSVVSKDKKQQKQYQAECDEVTEFWKYPDKLNEFSSWLSMLLDDHFVLDAMTLYKRKTLGGELYALEVVDGSTIKPLLDSRGRVLAYQQILYGYPRSDYQRFGSENSDVEQPNFPTFSTNELLYRPRYLKTNSPYGRSPTEWVIIRVNTAIRKQMFDLRYFTDGNIPDAWITPSKDAHINVEQLRTFEDNFNALLEGNDAARRKVRFLPWAGDVREMRPFSYDTKLDDWMMRLTCAAYGVTPTEIGFTDNTNRATSDGQENITYRRGIHPLTKWLKELFDRVIQQDMKHPDLEWQWQLGEVEDDASTATTDQIYISAGVVSPEEVRQLRFADTLEGPAPATINEQEMKAQMQQGVQPGQPGQPGNQQGQQQQGQIQNSGANPAAPTEEKMAMSGGNQGQSRESLEEVIIKNVLEQLGLAKPKKPPKVPKNPEDPANHPGKVRTATGWKTPAQPKAPKAVGFGSKPVGTRVYGQKNILNTNAPGGKAPSNKLQPWEKPQKPSNKVNYRSNNSAKAPAGIASNGVAQNNTGRVGNTGGSTTSPTKPSGFSGSGTSTGGASFSHAAGLNPDLLKALLEGQEHFRS